MRPLQSSNLCIYIHIYIIFFFNDRRHGASSSSMDTGRQDFLVYVLSLLRGHSNEHGGSLPQMDVSSLPHVAYVLDALVYYIRNNPNASSEASKRSSAEKTETVDTTNEDEGGDDVEDEDSASFKRDADDDDDTDHVDDEPMPTPNIPGHLHRFVNHSTPFLRFTRGNLRFFWLSLTSSLSFPLCFCLLVSFCDAQSERTRYS